MIQYLLLGKSGKDINQTTLPLEYNDYDDCVISIATNSVSIYCTSALYDVLFPTLCHIPNILFYRVYNPFIFIYIDVS